MTVTEPDTEQPRTARPEPPPRQGPKPLPVEPGIPLPPDSLGYRMKCKVLGPPLHTEELENERLGRPTALAVFASDNLSSSAYATEEILRVLAPGGSPRSRRPTTTSCPMRTRPARWDGRAARSPTPPCAAAVREPCTSSGSRGCPEAEGCPARREAALVPAGEAVRGGRSVVARCQVR